MLNKYWIYFGIVVLVSSSIIYGLRLIPAVRVSGISLSYADYYADRDGLVLYKNQAKENFSDSDIEKSVISSFVQDSLIKTELYKRGKTEEDVESLVSSTIDPKKIDTLTQATRQLYGWTMDDFKKFILYPEARKEMLMDEFMKENTNFDEWLARSIKNANVVVFMPRWRWQGGAISARY